MYSNVMSSGRNEPGTGTGFNRHVTQCHAPFHGQRAHGRAGIFDDMPGAAGGADMPDDRQRNVFGRRARRQARRRL